jgi:hypothetical protein
VCACCAGGGLGPPAVCYVRCVTVRQHVCPVSVCLDPTHHLDEAVVGVSQLETGVPPNLLGAAYPPGPTRLAIKTLCCIVLNDWSETDPQTARTNMTRSVHTSVQPMSAI